MILGICSSPDVMKVARIINIIITILKIVVPVLLIVVSMITYMNVINTSEADISKSNKTLVIRFIAAACIFFVPTFVRLIVDVIDGNDEYTQCLEKITTSDINHAYEEVMEDLVSKAEEEQTYDTYNPAKIYLVNITNSDKKKSYSDRLAVVYEAIKAKEETVKGKPVIDNPYNGIYFPPLIDPPYPTTYSGNTYCTYANSTRNIHHDIYAAVGTPVYAPFNGTATFSQTYCDAGSGYSADYLKGYGNKIRIDGDNGESVVMGHFETFLIDGEEVNGPISNSCNTTGRCKSSCSTVSLVVGTAKVRAGEVIGYSGNVGNSDGPHLHLELKEPDGDTCVVNPWKDYFGY